MAVRVVCISLTTGALGERIGSLVAERLSFRYVDEQVIERAAQLAQVDPKLAAARDLVGPVLAVGAPVFAVSAEHRGYRAKPEDLRLLIRAAILELASDGRAVIVAHAASMMLATRTDVVRVLVTASAETRARRLVAAQGIASEAAVAAIATADRNRRDYFRRFYDIDQEQPTHYDLVVNTDVLTPEQAAELIVCATRAGPEP